MAKASPKIVFGAGLVIGGVFLWLAIRNVEWGLVAMSLKHANLWLIPPFLASLVVFFWLKAVRWSYLLSPSKHIATSDLVPPMMIGFAGNNIFPARLGELIRVYVLGKDQKMSKSLVLATIILERMFDAISILVLLTLAMSFASVNSADLTAVRLVLFTLVIISFVVAYGILLAPPWLSNAIAAALDLLPGGLGRAVTDRFHHLRQGLASLRQKQALVRILLNSIAQWLLMSLCVYLSLRAFNLGVSPPVAVLVLGLVVAGISLPSAPGFIGTIEYCFVLGLGFFGVTASDALATGLFYHALMFVSVTLAGLLFLRRYKASMQEIRRQAADANLRGN